MVEMVAPDDFPVELRLLRESVTDRRLRVDQLRRLVSEDSYVVPGTDVAAAILAFFQRELPPRPVENTEASGNSW